MIETKLKKDFYYDVIHCLTNALEVKDIYTKGHSTRVGDMAYELTKALGLSDELCETVHIAGHLHDIGKIGISEIILNKKGQLTDVQWEEMKKHPQIGYGILSKSPRLKEVAEIVIAHHERWDGSGYPDKLKGQEIPIGARIIAVCDTIDAMTSERPYRKSFSWSFCWRELQRDGGLQFDPDIIANLETVFWIWKERYENSVKSA
jgi:HD-GYP domain-containing protein (c-di-GMP phosphodiesterase class II)